MLMHLHPLGDSSIPFGSSYADKGMGPCKLSA